MRYTYMSITLGMRLVQFSIFRILEDDTIPIQRKKPFTCLLSEVYLISDRKSLTTISTLTNAQLVALITFSIMYTNSIIHQLVNYEFICQRQLVISTNTFLLQEFLGSC